MEPTARIHIEDGSYWADVPELPGCFASGDTLDELFESLQEGVALYLAGSGRPLVRRAAWRLPPPAQGPFRRVGTGRLAWRKIDYRTADR